MVTMSKIDYIEKAKDIIKTETDALFQIIKQLDRQVLEKITKMIIECPGHILVTGAGTSRAVALRFAHLLACCGTPALPINAADALHGGAGSLKTGDVVFVISKGGKSREINLFVNIARQRGAKIIAQTENPDSPLAQQSDIIYNIIAPPEVDPYGMIATGTSLVNCLAGDVLCAILLEIRGYSKEAFGVTHPEGAVGQRLQKEKIE